MVKIYVADISRLMKQTEIFATCYKYSTKERREKADKRRCREDKARCIGAGLLLQYAYDRFEENIEKIDFSKTEVVSVDLENVMAFARNCRTMPPEKEGENGKPCLQNAPNGKKMFFNLSHSGSRVACMTAGEEVGLDIQKICHMRETVVKRCFLPSEALLLQGKDADRMFTRIWSEKEAAAKLTGKGLSQILQTSAENYGSVVTQFCFLDEEYVLSYAYYDNNPS